MKAKTQFICELCETTYDTPDEALKCEKTHIKPVIDGPIDPKPEYDYRAKYPRIIKIGFEDGVVREYNLLPPNWRDGY
ncbi:MAG: hypothetical protein AB1652_09720 [Bacillota bacterium]